MSIPSPTSHTPASSKSLTLCGRLCALAGFLGVALGAFGAHGLKSLLTANNGIQWWETATHYHLVHAVAALVALTWLRATRASWFFLAGITIFSGTLYIMALTGFRWLGAITPIGGILLLIGWAILGFGKRAE